MNCWLFIFFIFHFYLGGVESYSIVFTLFKLRHKVVVRVSQVFIFKPQNYAVSEVDALLIVSLVTRCLLLSRLLLLKLLHA